MRAVHVTVVESETGVPGAVLDLLVSRLHSVTDARVGGGPASGSPPATRLLAALLGAAASGPLVIVVDDVQWLDELSERALAFAVRRILADPVGVLLAGRPEVERMPWLAEVPRLAVEALPEGAARELLASVAPGLRDSVAADVVRSLGAVPLALVEAAQLLSPDERPDGHRYRRPCGSGRRSRTATPVAAGRSHRRPSWPSPCSLPTAGPIGRSVTALARCGLTPAGLEDAEAVGLVSLAARPAFVHPLARAAAYSVASPAHRRRAHDALASAYGDAGDSGRALPTGPPR